MKKLKGVKLNTLLQALFLFVMATFVVGVSLSRYTFVKRNTGNVTIPNIIADYYINDISSLSFNNADYWISYNYEDAFSPTNSALNMNFTVFNYKNNGIDNYISGVDLNSTLEFCGELEFIDNLAVQIFSVDEHNTKTPVTPQYILGNFLYDVTYDDDLTNGYGNQTMLTGKYTYVDDVKTFATSNRTILTSRFVDYGEVENSIEETFSVSGAMQETAGVVSGSVIAQSNNTTIKITTQQQVVKYALGFQRNNSKASRTTLYFDLEKEFTLFNVSISLPDTLQKNVRQSYKYDLALTPVNKIEKDRITVVDEVTTENEMTLNQVKALLQAPTSTETKTLDGAKVLGFHFDYDSVPVYNLVGGSFVDSTLFSRVRFQRVFDYNGSFTDYVYHTALPEDNEKYVNVPHNIKKYYNASAQEIEAPTNVSGFANVYAKCADEQNSNSYLLLTSVTGNPFPVSTYNVTSTLSKGYLFKTNITFTQASQGE